MHREQESTENITLARQGVKKFSKKNGKCKHSKLLMTSENCYAAGPLHFFNQILVYIFTSWIFDFGLFFCYTYAYKTKSPVPRVLGMNTCTATPLCIMVALHWKTNAVGFIFKQLNSKQLKLVHFSNNYNERAKITFLSKKTEIILHYINNNILNNFLKQIVVYLQLRFYGVCWKPIWLDIQKCI